MNCRANSLALPGGIFGPNTALPITSTGPTSLFFCLFGFVSATWNYMGAQLGVKLEFFWGQTNHTSIQSSNILKAYYVPGWLVLDRGIR